MKAPIVISYDLSQYGEYNPRDLFIRWKSLMT